MVLIVGLGNPGKKYEKTRHNVGFLAVDELAKTKTRCFKLAKPQTFMNRSGRAVKALVRFYNVKPDNLWIIHDDIDLSLGKIKISKGRGSAGHRGVQSIIDELKTKDFWRVRIGICPEAGKPNNVEKFVLQNFTQEEEKTLKELVPQIFDLLQSEINKQIKNNV